MSGSVDDLDANERDSGAEVIARLYTLADRNAVDELMPYLSHGGSEVGMSIRATAARLLGVLRAERAVAPLRLLLVDNDETVRIAAMRALGRIRARDAVDNIIELTGDDSRTGLIAVDVLAQIGDARAAPAIRRLLAAPYWSVRWSAASALISVEGRRAIPDVQRLVDSEPSRGRRLRLRKLIWKSRLSSGV